MPHLSASSKEANVWLESRNTFDISFAAFAQLKPDEKSLFHLI